jgi:SsrA-binding protein
MEGGLALKGTEVKSLRVQSPSLREAYVEVRDRGQKGTYEAWLVNAHIQHYSHGNQFNHQPTQARKVLLHKKEILRLHVALTQEGMTVVVVQMYFKNGRAKIEIGLARGKKAYDKRQDIKGRDVEKDLKNLMKKSLRKGS